MPSPLAALASVLAVHEVDGSSDERRSAVQRGRSLLDELDRIRAGLLDDSAAVPITDRLVGLLRTSRRPVEEAHLDAVLEEIELRAAVELAKRQQGGSG